LKVKFVPLRPTRSTFPFISSRSGSPSAYSANRMLDEPPFIVSKVGDTRPAFTMFALVVNAAELAKPLG
jgi:hypothetical protein